MRSHFAVLDHYAWTHLCQSKPPLPQAHFILWASP